MNEWVSAVSGNTAPLEDKPAFWKKKAKSGINTADIRPSGDQRSQASWKLGIAAGLLYTPAALPGSNCWSGELITTRTLIKLLP
jgi:hypothetical protein